MKLKNLKFYFIALLACSLIACSDDDKKNDNGGLDDTGDYTDSPLTPDQNKAKLENIGKEFVAKINASDHKTIVTSIQALSEALNDSNFEDFFPDYLKNDNNAPMPPDYFDSFIQVIEHNDANALMHLATKALNDDEYRISDFAGIYTYNATTLKWSQAPATNKLEFHYNIEGQSSVLAVNCSNIKEYTKVDGVLIEVPANTTVTLTVDNQKVLDFVTTITLSNDQYSADVTSTLTLANNYIWTITASAKAEKAAVTYNMTIKDEELISGTAEITGTKLTDPDYIDNNSEDIFNNGNFDFKILNLRLKGKGDIKAIVKGVDKIDKENPWDYKNYNETKDKENAEALRDLFNSYMTIEGFYTQEKQKFADVKMGIYSEDYKQYIYNPNKGEYGSYDINIVKDWDIQPVLIFTDKSEVEFDAFFTESRFSSLISSVETLVNKYMDMLGKKPVEF